MPLQAPFSARAPFLLPVLVATAVGCGEAPTALLPSVLTTAEDTPLELILDGIGAAAVEVTQAPVAGTLDVDAGSAPLLARYTPAPDRNGEDVVAFVVLDADGRRSKELRLTIDVTAVNDAPVLSVAAPTTGVEGQFYSATATAVDVDGDPVVISVVGGPAWLSLDGTSLRGTPGADDVGTHSVFIEADDGQGANDQVSFTVTIAGLAGPPVASPLEVAVDEDASVAIHFDGVGGDTAALTFAVATSPGHGTLSSESGATLTYQPEPNFHGVDTFSYVARDSTTTSAPATVSITIRPQNDAPTAGDVTLSVSEGRTGALLFLGEDIDGDVLTYSIVTPPIHGTVDVRGNTAIYRANGNFSGDDHFSYIASDGTATSAAANGTVTVVARDDAPVPVAATAVVDEDGTVEIPLVAVDPEGDAVRFQVVNSPTRGVAVISGDTLAYSPFPDVNGADFLTFTATDGRNVGIPATITITINPINDAPIVQAFSATVVEDGVLDFRVIAFDRDDEPFTLEVLAPPTHGQLVFQGNNGRYTPSPNFNGTDVVTVVGRDAVGDGSSVLFTFQVLPAPDDGVFPVDDIVFAERNVLLELPTTALTANDVDLDGDLEFLTAFNARNSRVTFRNGVVEFRPNLDFVGEAGFTYLARGSNGISRSADVVVIVGDNICGNGVVGDREICDDGNALGGDGCSATCEPEECGNAVTDVGEECDDGRLDGFACDVGCLLPRCGNGVVGPDEQCDDGNDSDGDGCNTSCLFEGCGDGVTQPLLGEECDDANDENGDGCDVDCSVSVCGNGIRAGDEECDDGNDDDGDLCRNNCIAARCGDGIISGTFSPPTALRFEWVASTCGQPSVVQFLIDGIVVVDTPMEGNCSCGTSPSVARLEASDLPPITGSSVVTMVADTATDAVVGWALVVVESDNGERDEVLFAVTPNEARDRLPNACRFAVPFVEDFQPLLGTEVTEECDDGNNDDDDGCSSSCLVLRCGDGRLDTSAGEACDDGNNVDLDGCSSACVEEFCGDGVLQDVSGRIFLEEEPNDDGDPDTGNVSRSDDNDFSLSANGPLTIPTLVLGTIGTPGDEDWFRIDNPADTPLELFVETFLDELEACEGGDPVLTLRDEVGRFVTSDDDTFGHCPALNFEVPPRSSRFIGVLAFGDSDIILEQYLLRVTSDQNPTLEEACDDGNDEDGDGCDSNCTITGCGNGVADDSEECDDGNEESGDGCNASCEVEQCGDGELQPAGAPITALTLRWLADSCEGPQDIVFVVNDIPIFLESSSACACDVPEGSITITAQDELAELGINDGVAQIQVAYPLGGPGSQTPFSWAIAEVTTANGSRDVVLADAGGRAGDPNALCFGAFSLTGFFAEDAFELRQPEVCDDGNAVSGDGCDSNCHFTGCGNGLKDDTEACDDGNTEDGDGCSRFCDVE